MGYIKNLIIEQRLLESENEKIVLNFIKNIIKGTEWENKLFLAGGAVRDEIMGLDAKDLDFVVYGDLNAGINFSKWLANQLNVYKEGSNPVIYPRFGTSKLQLKNNNQNLPNIELEFVAPRKEKYNKGSRKPDVTDGELLDDVLRRDLTINSLLKNISTDQIIDMTGKGVDDIKSGVIRTTSKPDTIFNEDPLRMLRAIRFAVKYNFDLSIDLIKAIKNNSNLITTISKERIADELNKILLTKNPDKGVRLLKITGLLSFIIDEFNDTFGMKQNIHHKDDVFKHTMEVLKNTPPNLKTRLMALFHDIGKTLTKSVTPEGAVHFYDHEKAGVDIVKNVMSRLRYPNELINAVVDGVTSHMQLKQAGDDGYGVTDKTLRKFKYKVGENLEDILDLIHADNISHSDESSMPNQIKNIRNRLENLDDKIEQNKQTLPITGKDLISLGLKPSPLFREILSKVEDMWYENPNITKEEALEAAKTIINNNKLNEISIRFKKLIK